MGTWATPHTIAQAQTLSALLKEGPLPAERAREHLYGLMGDDGLFDLLGEMIAHGETQVDARPAVAHHLDRWLESVDDPDAGWVVDWDPQAVALLRSTLEDLDGELGLDLRSSAHAGPPGPS